MKRTFELEKETKGALRYVELDLAGNPLTQQDPEAVCGTIYVRKAVLNGQIPQTMTITFSWE